MPRIRPVAVARALLASALLATGAPRNAGAMCCPMPCDDCELLSFGQMNFVVMDRAAGRIRLVPNIRIVGTAPEFALVIPTPTAPALAPAPAALWNELSLLTAPVAADAGGDDGFFGCSGTDDAPLAGTDATAGDRDATDVEIISRQKVGAFIAVTITSEVPDALVRWLRDNGYPVSEDEAAAFGPLVQRDWVFTAMKLDPSRPEGRMPDGGWNSSVEPVELSFAADGLEVPLEMLAINRGDSLPMAFFVVDDHRTTLEGFTTNYANKLSRSEHSAIERAYPNASAYLDAGRFITRLDRTFVAPEPMTGILPLATAATDAEFRRVRGSTFGSFGVEMLLWLALPWVGRFARRGGRRAAPRSDA